MSDISISFPAWMTPLLIGLLYWPLLLGAAAAFAGLAMVLRGWRRAGLLGLAGIAALPCLMVLGMDIVSAVHSGSARRPYARAHKTLSTPLQIQGLTLPAGTAVTWVDERHEAVASVELPGPIPLLGTTLNGKLDDVSGRWWSGTFAADAQLEGWRCRAGDVWLSHEGRPMRCTLAADQEHQGLEIPAGSEIALSVSGRLQDLRMPTDRTMALRLVNATLPSGSSLYLQPDGRVERAYVPEPGMLQVGNVALRFEIRWVYPEPALPAVTARPGVALRGELAGDATLDGILAPAGTLVTVDLRRQIVCIAPAR